MKILEMPVIWGKKCIITYDGDGIVALDIENEQPHVGYIHDLVVAESQRKQGIGTELLEAAIDEAELKGCNKVVLWCEPIEWLHQWYERKGFVETEIGEYGYARMLKIL
jgi:GNAT superfamily N-acetyltransferase